MVRVNNNDDPHRCLAHVRMLLAKSSDAAPMTPGNDAPRTGFEPREGSAYLDWPKLSRSRRRARLAAAAGSVCPSSFRGGLCPGGKGGGGGTGPAAPPTPHALSP